MSLARFLQCVVEGDDCFICGATRTCTDFNKEHVLPDWILRRYRLHSSEIALPHGESHRYGTYRIPCCTNCNGLLSQTFEQPLSDVCRGGHAAVADHMRAGYSGQLFLWLALIFLKSHLKDLELARHLDRRKGAERVGDAHPWEEVHHIHCLVRSVHTGAVIGPEAVGTLVLFPAALEPDVPPFDLIDLTELQTIVLRMDDIVVAAVLNDSGAVRLGLRGVFEQISGPLTAVQVRELAAHLACCNAHLLNRPRFQTRIDLKQPPHVFVEAEHDSSPSFAARDANLFGGLLHRLLEDVRPHVRVPGIPESEVDSAIKAGRVSFLR